MKYCKNCGAELNDNAAVCTKCGVLVGEGNKFCPNCGAEPDPLAVICVKCGYELKPIRPNGTSTTQSKKVENYNTHDNDFVWAVKTCFSKYATFSGRARRKEFWYWYLFVCLTTIAAFLLSGILSAGTIVAYAQSMQVAPPSSPAPGIFIILNGIWSLVIFLPNLAVTVRRLHDAGHSGWYYLISCIPIIGIILLLVALCTDSVADNEYGKNPKLA